ncbi:MAG: hypothetical protein QM743_13680 [Chitinophagaceae bacterium]
MDIKSILTQADPNLVTVLLTGLIAFISWLTKNLIEKPLIDSKTTFNKLFEKRVEILTEFKSKLSFLAYFPDGRESMKYKLEIQSLLMVGSKSAYLNKELFDNLMLIAIKPETSEKLILSSIQQIDEELHANISKVYDEMKFYRSFSNYAPIKRITSLSILYIQYFLSIFIVGSISFLAIFFLLNGCLVAQIIVVLFAIIAYFLITKWLK